MDYQNPQMGQIPQMEPAPKQPGRFLNPKILWIVIAVLVIIILAGGVWAFRGKIFPPKVSPSPSATPDETANWQTYTNSQLGLEFKHPTDWIIHFIPKEDDIVPFDVLSFSNRVGDFTAQLSGDPKFVSKGSLDANVNYYKINGSHNLDIENGKVFYGWANVNTDSGPYFWASIITKNAKYIFSGVQVEGTASQSVDFFAKFVSTFKFTAVAVSNGKIYTNTKYNYSIQYPDSWNINLNSANNDFGTGGFAYTTEGPLQVISGNYSSAGGWRLTPAGSSDDRDVMSFEIAKPDPAQTLDAFFNTFPNFPNTKENLIIDGMSAVRISSKEPCNPVTCYKLTETLVMGKDRIYVFMYLRPDLYNDIIDSFKLTK